jgi:hypothetical protein
LAGSKTNAAYFEQGVKQIGLEKMNALQTNNFSNSLTWITRLSQFLIGMIVLYLVDLQELQTGLLTGSVFACLLAFVLITFPVDEIVLQDDKLLFKKKSLVPFFNRTIIYDVSRLKGVGSFSVSGTAGIQGLFIPILNAYRVEFIFNDNSSESREVLARKSDLKKILVGVRELIKQNNA